MDMDQSSFAHAFILLASIVSISAEKHTANRIISFFFKQEYDRDPKSGNNFQMISILCQMVIQSNEKQDALT